MQKLRNALRKYFLNRSLKKRVASLKAFRHTDADILPAQAHAEIDELLEKAQAITAAPTREACKLWANSAGEVIHRYNRHGTMREILDILAVALMVAFGIRALFFQPFKIPTSSMQPTLFGVHYIDIEESRNVDGTSSLLGKLTPVGDYLLFASRQAKLELPRNGLVAGKMQPTKDWLIFDSTIIPFSDGSRVKLPGTPEKTAAYTDIYPGRRVSGKVVNGYLSDGDHLFVNRLSLHFREPRRGDVMVFATEGIVGPGGEKPSDSGDYYIKRIVGLPGDTLKIVNNVLMVKPADQTEFVPIYKLAPNMAKLYSGRGGYQGHSNRLPGVTHFLKNNHDEFTVSEDCYFMLGDNTRFSSDSRVWGEVPRKNLIGRPAVIFWPFSRRWGTVDRLNPLDVPTGRPGKRTFPSMNLQ